MIQVAHRTSIERLLSGGPRPDLALRVLAIGLFAVFVIGVIVGGTANGSLGFDFRAYYLAAQHLIAGESIYDLEAVRTGGFGLFSYPPPFLLMVLPFLLLPEALAVNVWTVLTVLATLAAIAVLPVAARTRWLVLLLAGLSSPLLSAINLGQVGPMLLLLFAVGWRFVDRAWPLGIVVGLGAMIKLQPAILVGWAVATGRLRAAGVAILVIAALAVASTLVSGPQAWLDEVSLLGRVSNPVSTARGVGVARLAYEAGLSEWASTILFWFNLALVVVVAGIAASRASASASYLAAVVVSQFISPVLWDHYALILLLPTAWLLDRKWWWAAVIPLATSVLVLWAAAPATYPFAFWLSLLAVTWFGIRENSSAPEFSPA